MSPARKFGLGAVAVGTCAAVAVAVALATIPSTPGSDVGVVTVEIKRGWSVRAAAQELEAVGVLRHQLILRYVNWQRGGIKLKAGKFEVPTPISPDQLAELLETAPPVEEQPFSVVEGARIADVDAALCEANRADAGTYAAAAHIPSDFRTEFPLPTGTLEGYLYPETYRFPIGPIEPRQLIERQLELFTARVWRPFKDEIERSPRSLQQLVVMASLLEREELEPANRPLLAGILWKRFDRRLPLGVDATSRYELGTWSDRKGFLVKLRDQTDPYNTRLRTGLPPTPIGSVTANSFEAALRPKPSEFLYYLHDPQKRLHTATDAAGHEKNRRVFGVY